MSNPIVALQAGQVEQTWEAARVSAQSGQYVIVHAPPETWEELAKCNGPHVIAGARSADPENPLVERELEPGLTNKGDQVHLCQPGNIHSSGGLATTQSAIYVDSCPAAVELRVGEGSVLLLAHEPTRTPQSRALMNWISETAHIPVEQLVTRPPQVTGHPEIPVVKTTRQDWSAIEDYFHANVDSADEVTLAGKASKHLPPNVYDALIDFVDHSNPAGALLVQGVPIGTVPDTPLEPGGIEKTDRTSERALLSAARLIGQPVGYLPEHRGELVQNISPTRAGAQAQVSTSSAVTLAYHTEAAFHPHQPRYLLLLCLRGDPQAATTLCSVHALMPALDANDIEELRKAQFTTGIDESYTHVRSQARGNPEPIISGNPEDPKLWLDVDLMEGSTPQAQRALERIGQLTSELGTSVTLQEGDLLIVDNHKAVHGRSPFTPRFDGTDRWLQRAMTVPDHTHADGQRSGRIIATRFHTT